jgi:hypothetical protein
MSKPKWWPYRSSKWMELMMLQAGRGHSLNDGLCPWCECAVWVCGQCIMLFGDSNAKVWRCSMTRFATVYGCTWRAAYPELVPPSSHETTEYLVNRNRWKYELECECVLKHA